MERNGINELKYVMNFRDVIGGRKMDYLNDLELVWGMDDMFEKIKVLEWIIVGVDLYNNIDDGIEVCDLLIDICLIVGFLKK